MQLGLPGGIETRKKAYLGVGMDDLLAKYSEAERKRDLPEMLALLDIIRAAPKPIEGPKTTVKDDLMAAVQPQQQAMMAPPAAGVEGALTAMENQNAPVTAVNGGAMNFDDEAGRDGFAEGGVARFQFGGAGTVAPFASYAGLSFGDIERMAMMGDP
jgi:membrane carboxypeptidase/penicillin-binding protein